MTDTTTDGAVERAAREAAAKRFAGWTTPAVTMTPDAVRALFAEGYSAALAARGDAATSTKVEWGVRYPSGNVDVKPEATARAVAERYADVPNGGAPVLMQRTVFAWREVEGGEQRG